MGLGCGTRVWDHKIGIGRRRGDRNYSAKSEGAGACLLGDGKDGTEQPIDILACRQHTSKQKGGTGTRLDANEVRPVPGRCGMV